MKLNKDLITELEKLADKKTSMHDEDHCSICECYEDSTTCEAYDEGRHDGVVEAIALIKRFKES